MRIRVRFSPAMVAGLTIGGLALGYFVLACLGAVALARVPQDRPGLR
jgi:hypothetical protein